MPCTLIADTARYGHLFQNRYKSILCQEDPYFQELVRSIHLNPLRANLVNGIGALDKYPYSGHSALMGMVKNEWQDTEYVLGCFVLCYWAVRDLGVSMTSLAKRLRLSVAAITQSVERGERFMKEKSYHFP
jgi:hypothetical protein